MRFLIFSLIIALPLSCFSQKEADKLLLKAWDYKTNYHYKGKDSSKLYDPYYDSAILYLKKLEARFPNYRRNVVEVLYQDCYFNTGQYSKSLPYALKISADSKQMTHIRMTTIWIVFLLVG